MDRTAQNARKDWEKFLDPDSLKINLIRASIYLASYELLKSTIVEKPRGFLKIGSADLRVDESEYKKAVLSLCPRDQLYASCLWFRKMVAIDDSDIDTIKEIRAHRNDIAHELPKYICDFRHAVNMQLLDSIRFLIGKIDRWWIREIEMEVNPAYDHVDKGTVPDSQIHSGSMMMMDLIHKVIYSQEDDLRQLLAHCNTLGQKNNGGSNNSTVPIQ